LGFVNYLDDLVAASYLVITKAGGLIVSEVMARQTPMVVIDPIPGQEEWNADYVVSVGAGVQIRLSEMVPVAVQHLLDAPDRLEALRARAGEAGRPQAAMAVAEAILKVAG
jgi:processive 1,2-diacylglycerol beta-glucosyltransferase